MDNLADLLPHVALRFNVDNPVLEECYADGYECGSNDIEEHHNPFKEGTVEFNYWRDGWWDGFYNEKPIFSVHDANKDDQINNYDTCAANDTHCHSTTNAFIARFLKITAVIAASAIISYQMIDLVA